MKISVDSWVVWYRVGRDQRWAQCGSMLWCYPLPSLPLLLLLPLFLPQQLPLPSLRRFLASVSEGWCICVVGFFLFCFVLVWGGVRVCRLADLQSLDGTHRTTTCKASTSFL